ncbi:hypothetical protein BXT84_10305 [Sulfobacillus thermotolerans]|uniref:Uncharacterized protein n=1 Tax=Sulfobacillus thermotolerans TaxID=338644 RepID=A0ABM6RSG6_9FIRM|nr:hypothetical protein BXT84_10305 [Sulfobacillus thermotolerans]
MVPDPSTTCLGMEYFCFEGDGLWNQSDDALLALAESELRSMKLIKQEHLIMDGQVVRVPKAYPVYDEGYQERIATIRHELAHIAHNLQLVGRNGMHRYNNQDHAMMTGFLAARNLLGGDYNLWAVNTDAEYLEHTQQERWVPQKVVKA